MSASEEALKATRRLETTSLQRAVPLYQPLPWDVQPRKLLTEILQIDDLFEYFFLRDKLLPLLKISDEEVLRARLDLEVLRTDQQMDNASNISTRVRAVLGDYAAYRSILIDVVAKAIISLQKIQFASEGTKKARRRRLSPLTDRQKIIRQAIKQGLRGEDYARYLDGRQLETPETWQKNGCKASYIGAYRQDDRWRARITDEKSKQDKKMRDELAHDSQKASNDPRSEKARRLEPK